MPSAVVAKLSSEKSLGIWACTLLSDASFLPSRSEVVHPHAHLSSSTHAHKGPRVTRTRAPTGEWSEPARVPTNRAPQTGPTKDGWVTVSIVSQISIVLWALQDAPAAPDQHALSSDVAGKARRVSKGRQHGVPVIQDGQRRH